MRICRGALIEVAKVRPENPVTWLGKRILEQADQAKADAWQQCYGLLGAFSSKAAQDTVAFLKKEGAEQVSDKNERAPAWTVLGQSKETPEKVLLHRMINN